MSSPFSLRPPGPGLSLALSAAAAVCAALLITHVLRGYEKELSNATPPLSTRPVVVAAHNLLPGRAVVADDLTIQQVPVGVTSDAAMRQIEEAVGRVPRSRILRGEPIRVERLAPRDAGSGLDALLEPGLRAVTLDITDGSAVSGFLDPGNLVDVLVTLRRDTHGGAFHTVTVLHAVRVLAVDRRLSETSEESSVDSENLTPSVTVAVTPGDAERLAHAHLEGRVTLALRNDTDIAVAQTPGTQTTALLRHPPAPEFAR